ncbi:MAG TPA: serine/threonine-protein kinase, partial [Archangium sp.]
MRLAGRYELIERIAEGGMAEVWLATAHGDAGFTRRVAIKQLFARQHDAGFERMFLDEARLTSRLHHQGIVSIVDFGIEAGRPFQVLELIDGADAWRLWKAGAAQGKRLPHGLALHICAQVGHALHFAHSAKDDAGVALNVVHRDVSPQNVLLSRAGDVKLSDFGIAFAEGRLEKTVGGIARGKPAYMAPEQAVRGAMDGRTDVFALGCVLHALFTGESALRDENALVDLLAGVDLSLDPSLPLDVREVIAKAVQRDKHARFESAEAFALACAALAPKYSAADPRTELASWVRSVSVEAPVRVPTPMLKPPPPSRRGWLLAV